MSSEITYHSTSISIRPTNFRIGLGAVLVAAFLWNLPCLWYPFEEGHAVAQLIGRTILDGGVPYRDILDVKPPAVFYLHALLIALFGEGMQWLRIADMAALFITMSLIARTGRWLGSPRGGLWGALLFGIAYPLLGFWKTAQSESFLLPFLWWSLGEAILRFRREGIRSLLLCGSALGMVFWFKYPYALPLTALIPWILLGSKKEGRARHLLLLVGSFLLMVTVVVLYFWAVGGLEDLYRITLEHNIKERLLRSGRAVSFQRNLLFWETLLRMPLWILIISASLAGLLCMMKSRRPGWEVAAAYTVCMMVVIPLQMRFYHYHVIPALSFLCFLSGIALEGLEKYVRTGVQRFRLPRAWLRILTAFMALAVFVMGWPSHASDFRRLWLYKTGRLSWEGYLATFPQLPPRSFPFVWQDWKISQDLKRLDVQRRTLFVWGRTPLIYYFSGLRPSTSFLYINFLIFLPPDLARPWQRRLEKEFLRAPPGVVLVRLPPSEPWTRSLERMERLIPRVSHLLHRDYILTSKLGPYLLYLHRRESES